MKLNSPSSFPGIVIVDDVPGLIRIYRKFFDRVGIRIIASFNNASDMLEFYSRSVVDEEKRRLDNSIVLLDHHMPVMNGEEAAKRLRKLNPNPRIVLATERDTSGYDFEDSLFDAVIQKPFSIFEFTRIIESVFPVTNVQGSRVLTNPEELHELVVEIISDAKDKICICGDYRFSNSRSFKSAHMLDRIPGLKVMFLTEITTENLFYCKSFMAYPGAQLRHLEGVELNLVIVDEKHLVENAIASGNPVVVKQGIYSNVESVVGCNQYLFDSMWNKAIPAEEKIRELEVKNNEHFQAKAISGVQENLSSRIRLVNNSVHVLDACYESRIASSLFSREIEKAYSDAITRGVKSRHITEITKENLNSCKNLIQIGIELRHLEGVVGAFAVNDREFDAKAISVDPEVDSESIYSDYPLFVEQHRSIFNTLWSLAVPASYKIKELESEKIPTRI